MNLTDKIIKFINSLGQTVFIEAEGKPKRLSTFIKEYNELKPALPITMNNDGIIVLQEDANKWGLELRLYLTQKQGADPDILSMITHNDNYRGEYSYRINNNKLIKELFLLGFVIGKN